MKTCVVSRLNAPVEVFNAFGRSQATSRRYQLSAVQLASYSARLYESNIRLLI